MGMFKPSVQTVCIKAILDRCIESMRRIDVDDEFIAKVLAKKAEVMQKQQTGPKKNTPVDN